MLYIFGGLPGAGKSALSRSLARARQAVYLRIDTIEQAMRDGGCRLQGRRGIWLPMRLLLTTCAWGESGIYSTRRGVRLSALLSDEDIALVVDWLAPVDRMYAKILPADQDQGGRK